jgi:hypothetical protein
VIIERQICLKCGHVYGEMEHIGHIGPLRSDNNDFTVCIYCSGKVVWKLRDESDDIADISSQRKWTYETNTPSLHSARITAWDKIKLFVGGGICVIMGIWFLGYYLRWWE